MKKRLSLLMVLMMVLSLVPMSVFATAGSMPGGAIKVDDTDEQTYKLVTIKLTQAAGTKLVSGGKAKMTLNKGEFAQITKGALVAGPGNEINGLEIVAGTTTTSGMISLADATTNLTRNVTFDTGKDVSGSSVPGSITVDPAVENVAYINIPTVTQSLNESAPGANDGTLASDIDIMVSFYAYFDKVASGDFTVSVNEVDGSGLDVAKPIVSGAIAEGTGEDMKMTVADAAKKISFDGGELSTVTVKDIDQNPRVDYLELELPDYVKWDLTSSNPTKASLGGLTLTLLPTADAHIVKAQLVGNTDGITNPTKKDLIVVPQVTVTKRDASKGDVRLKVIARDSANSKLETIDAVIGQIADYDVTMTAWEKGKKEIPAMYGGDEKTVKVKLSGVKGSFTDKRDIDFTIKGADIMWTGAANTSADVLKGTKNLSSTASNVKKDGNKVEDGEFTLTVNGSNVDELEFEMKIKADWAQNGAVTLEADSRDFGKLEAEIAKVTPAYTVETKMTSVKKGESLATADIVVKEAKAGMFDTDNYLVLNLRDKSNGRLTFGADYKVEATNGMKISDGLYDANGATRSNLDSLSIEIKTSSSKEAGTITISNVLVKVDGSTVDGDKMLETYLVEKGADAGTPAIIGGTPAGVKSKATAVEYALSREADLDPDYSVKYVNAVKEYGAVATVTVFKIGSKEYTVNGETKTANEAPYVSGKGYTMLPVRAIGESLGLKADWNAATKTATFSNDSKVASVVIGADTMYVNGTPFKLSAKAEIKNGSTFVELRSLASAFGVKLEWDAATKSVTIQG